MVQLLHVGPSHLTIFSPHNVEQGHEQITVVLVRAISATPECAERTQPRLDVFDFNIR
jgi:hypothetical protein